MKWRVLPHMKDVSLNFCDSEYFFFPLDFFCVTCELKFALPHIFGYFGPPLYVSYSGISASLHCCTLFFLN